MGSEETEKSEAVLPAGGLQWMGLIVVALALFAIYANVQRARRPQIETATIQSIAPTPTPAPAAP
ncbi:MAG: hypothetical protein ABIR71_09155 [Chthoniobacterales bacterium]